MIKALFFAPQDGTRRLVGFFLVNFSFYRKGQRIRYPLLLDHGKRSYVRQQDSDFSEWTINAQRNQCD